MTKKEIIISPLDIPLNVLLADDDEDETFLFEKVLKKMPFNLNFYSVINGDALINYLLKIENNGVIDLSKIYRR